MIRKIIGLGMICAVITGPTMTHAEQQLKQASQAAGIVELRLDRFSALDIAALEQLRSTYAIPMIFTLRSASQGGSYKGSEEERLADLRRLADLEPEYLDLEDDIPLEFVQEIAAQHPRIQLIISHHNFKETPSDLDALYQQMCETPGSYYKIAVKANSSLDALRLLAWAQGKERVIAVSMGELGQISRVLAPVVGSGLSYAALDAQQATAPGQLSMQILEERYRYSALKPTTAICALIGDPVSLSISDETHNQLMGAFNLDAVYVKILIKEAEVPQFLQLAKLLPFRGVSVTMPLKETVIPELDQIDQKAQEIGAVNTLCLNDGQIKGYNTDGMGTLNAIEQRISVRGKHLVVIGAGGSAKAIAYEALRRGADVTIVNRSPDKAIQLAAQLGCRGYGLDQMATLYQTGYDVLINTTPDQMPIDPAYMLPHTVTMDIKTKPKETLFLQHARSIGCPIVYGYELFVGQAVGQFALWFKDQIDPKSAHQFLEQASLKALEQ